jgi:hypothetical protein
MKFINKISLLTSIVLIFASCNYLDVVPDNNPTLDDAFKNRSAAEKSLFTCYSYLPDPTNPYFHPAQFTAHDEFEIGTTGWVNTSPAYMVCNGYQNTNSPQMNYWSGQVVGNSKIYSMFEAIRVCNIFLEGIGMPRDIESYEREKWIAEVKFLKAYYHFFLLQLYGPIPLIKENLNLGSSPEEVRVFREPVDECVDYIVKLIDEAVPDLPLTPLNPMDENGRITQPIALSVKAKVLVWAASPLFNGNQDYAGWKDKRGKQLISPTYSKEKWERAAVAVKNAIDTRHLAGNQLYAYNKSASGLTYKMSDSIVQTLTIRKAITERWNSGVIWSSTAQFANGKGNMSYAVYGNMQRALYPALYSQDLQAVDGSKLYASFSMAELFYSNKGIPIEEDASWGYGDRYKTQVSTANLQNSLYIPLGEITAHLNFNREPRFYADLGFDRGYYQLSTGTNDGGMTFPAYLQLRFTELGSGTNPTGYTAKKLVAFETSGSQGGASATYSGYDYRFPLIRLSDLYLLYSEVLNEVKEAPDAEVYNWIDQVRAAAGLKGVVESWKDSNRPDRPSDKNEMRKIIQQERMIELAFEGQRFWDVRRWKLAQSLWSQPTYTWNWQGSTADTYYQRTKYTNGLNFTFRDYLWPIKDVDLRINTNLEQTYGW